MNIGIHTSTHTHTHTHTHLDLQIQLKIQSFTNFLRSLNFFLHFCLLSSFYLVQLCYKLLQCTDCNMFFSLDCRNYLLLNILFSQGLFFVLIDLDLYKFTTFFVNFENFSLWIQQCSLSIFKGILWKLSYAPYMFLFIYKLKFF